MVAGCCLGMSALKPRLLVFNAINFPALWTCRQDDELVIDNQGFWFRRTAKVCLNTERRQTKGEDGE
jgi:hypothetical protein